MIDCLIDIFRLEYNFNTNTTHNTQGVEVRTAGTASGAGSVASVEYLNELHLSSFGYFAPIIRGLTINFAYERDVNLRGIPYDFRKAPNELSNHFAELLYTSEQMYRNDGRVPLTYICHSMGCANMLYFLHNRSQEWKDTHVKRLISLAAPWAGSMQALKAVAFGDNLGMPYLFDEAKLNIVQRSVPSTVYLFPNAHAYGDTPLIKTNVASDNASETLTARDLTQLFERLQHPEGLSMWLNTKDLLGSLQAPGVEVWCLYGRGFGTLGRMEFKGDFPDSERTDLLDDGDGTVPLISSTYCEHWSAEQSQAVHMKEFNVDHVDMLRDHNVLETISSIMNSP